MDRFAPACALVVLFVAACGDPTATTATAATSTGETSGTTGSDTTTTSGTTDDPTAAPTSTTTTSTTTTTTTDATSSSSGTTGEPDHYPDADSLFGIDAIAEFDITLSDNALLALDVEPHVFTQGDLQAQIK